MFVASVGAVWLREILLTFCTSNPVIAIAARPPAWSTFIALATLPLPLTLHPLLPLMTVKTLLAVRTIALIVAWAAEAGWRLNGIGCRHRRSFSRRGAGFTR